MHPDFKNKGNVLGLFIEECGEALAAAGKTVRYGWGSYSPLVPEAERETNEDWLRREISDVEFAISRIKKARGWEESDEAQAPSDRTIAPDANGEPTEEDLKAWAEPAFAAWYSKYAHWDSKEEAYEAFIAALRAAAGERK